jgi:rSAM/selenodomain-associated transferase 1
MTGLLVVYGREPVPGAVKTRLAADLGEGAAAAVYRVLLDHALEVASSSRSDAVLALAEAPSAEFAATLPLPWELQAAGDLGERLADTFRRHFSSGRTRVAIVGSDCAELEASLLDDALARLRSRPIVLGPARDGGYWLIGQEAPGQDLFSGISFSSVATLTETRRRIEALGLEWSELVELSDVDTSRDLRQALTTGRLKGSVRRRLVGALQNSGVGL